ncbi:hypothetical protein MASR2M17_17170 [Aminivibrio sp.]
MHVFAVSIHTFWEFDSRIFKTTLLKLLAGISVKQRYDRSRISAGLRHDAVDDISGAAGIV